MMKQKFSQETGLIKSTPLYLLTCAVLLVVLAVSVLSAVTFGTVKIPVSQVYRVILHELFGVGSSELGSGSIHDVVWLIRLPRLILAVAVGMGLSVCGVVMQAIVKNPLADPYILGVSSGASLGATVAIMLGSAPFWGLAPSGSAPLPAHSVFPCWCCFCPISAGAKWQNLFFLFPIVLVSVLFFWIQYRSLNLMLLGDEVSITLGTDLHRRRQGYLLLASLVIGFVVYASGMIGFVGLVIPHLVRMLFGTDHKKLIPLSALPSAVFPPCPAASSSG